MVPTTEVLTPLRMRRRYLPGTPTSFPPAGGAWHGSAAEQSGLSSGEWQLNDGRAADAGGAEAVAAADDDAEYELSDEWAERFALSELRREEREWPSRPIAIAPRASAAELGARPSAGGGRENDGMRGGWVSAGRRQQRERVNARRDEGSSPASTPPPPPPPGTRPPLGPPTVTQVLLWQVQGKGTRGGRWGPGEHPRAPTVGRSSTVS
jgi:hypothetical protein